MELAKASRSIKKPITYSAYQEKQDSVSLSANSAEVNSGNCSVQQVERSSKGSSDIWSRISQTATKSGVVGAKQLLSAVNLGSTTKQTVEPSKSFTGTAELSSDVFPRFSATKSPVLHRKRFTPPGQPSSLRASWSIKTSPLNANLTGKQLSTFPPGLLRLDLDSDLLDRSSMCTMDKQCGAVEHACTDLDDEQIVALWERTVECYVNAALENEVLIDIENQAGTGSMALSNIHLNTKELQLVVVKHNERKICCASGLSLVYWLVSNVDEMDHCRWRARSACQRFMDLSLLLDLNQPKRMTFRDDFTPYELRPVRSPVTLSPCNLERRVSWPATTVPTSRVMVTSNFDEPDWLREIEDFSSRVPSELSSGRHRSLVTNDEEIANRHISSTRSPGRATEVAGSCILNSFLTLGVRPSTVDEKPLLLLDDSDAECEIFPGTILTKRPTHRFMPTVLHYPRILLLSCSIDYQRTLTKMTWLDSQIMQEEEYLSNCVSKLLCLRPKVIFVGGGVSHAAQMFLLKAGVTLFSNVKQSVLKRIARITGAEILESVDRLVSDGFSKGNSQRPVTQLGICQQFQVKQVTLPDGTVKFLTLIKRSIQDSSSMNSVPADSRALLARNNTMELTVVLHGPDLSELKRVKRCLLYAIYLCYNTKLELSFAYNSFIFWPSDKCLSRAVSDNKSSSRDSAPVHSAFPAVTTGDDVLWLSSTKSASRANVANTESVTLADLLTNRLYSSSPAVHVCLPFLASPEGRNVPLAAYYTYVIEWPFGRKLNDLLKRKLKVMRAEMYALNQERKSRLNSILMEQKTHTGQLCDHPFVTCHLGRLERSILDPRSHQFFSFLTTLYTSKSFMWPESCVPPWIATVEFYGLQDLPLGLFLEKCCFTQQHCRHPHCEVPMTEHVQRFVQTTGSVQLVIRKLNQDPPRPCITFNATTNTTHTEVTDGPEPNKSRPDSRIQMWLVCPYCRSNSPTVYLSADTWHYSFVKFLDSLINTPTNQGRCALHAPVVSVAERASGNNKTDNMTSESTTVKAVQQIEPTLQLTCTHSAYKTMQHCFAFERKLAMFKFQPVIVYEVVMPPNEIRIYHPSATVSSAPESATKAQQSLSFSASDPVVGGKANEIPTDETTRGDSTVPQRMNNKSTTVALPSSSFLYSEAMDVLEKYYHVYAVVKSHLITLQQDNVNSDVFPTLKTLVYLLETDSRKAYMDVRAELLHYLFHPDGKMRIASTLVPFTSAEKQMTSVRSVSSFTQLATDLPKNKQSATEELDSSDTIPLFSLTAGVVQSPLVASRFDTATLFQSPILRVRDPANMNSTATGWNVGLAEDWCSLVGGLDTGSCTEFESLVKRAEKSAKEVRKKVPSGGAGGLISPHPPSRSPKSSTLDMGLLANDGSAGSNPTLLVVDVPSVDQANSVRSTRSLIIPSETGLQSNGTFNKSAAAPRLPSLLVSDTDTSLPACPLVDTLRRRADFADSDTQIASTSVLNSDICSESAARNVAAIVVSSMDDSSSRRQSRNDLVEKRQRLSVLDPLHLKAVYQNSESENGSGVPSPQSVRKFLPVPETSVQAVTSGASISASSGMRRLIHTLLPSSAEPKPFDEPFPPHEHPQLSLADDINQTVFRRSQNASFLVQQAEASGSSARSPEYLQNLVQHLRFSVPDVFVNDRELTSIIAYALSTYEYERHLVDLHAVGTTRSSMNASVQIGQSALLESGCKRKESSGHPSPVSSVATMRNNIQSSVISDKDAVLPNSARSSVISSRSTEHPLLNSVSKKSFTSSTTSTTHANHMRNSSGNNNLSSAPSQNPPVSGQLINGIGVPTASGSERNGPSSSRHIKIQFSDSATQFFCCVYYASEFFRLRQLLLPQGDVGFIRSLSRCYQWDARGGKSGSLFMKTSDERFIVKELSSIEMKTFHEISKQYFDYLIGAALEQRLCVLSRILGVFHVGFKNSISGEAHRFDVLVMENLFHDRPKLRFIYDLKGSLRKRLADEESNVRYPNETGDIRGNGLGVGDNSSGFGSNTDMFEVRTHDQQRPDPMVAESGHASGTDGQPRAQKHVPVLLDQNLLNASVDSPLYLRVHSKAEREGSRHSSTSLQDTPVSEYLGDSRQGPRYERARMKFVQCASSVVAG
ncbi:1-phosphatidylinositol 3-phosphate 5-kinase [Fasciola gigantica]|uniref:1-phosphatidylinositol-3-phosphate 5-kinase n=1 Tax=Fasciola gigantica TaxID=46835 RepID=A0A504YIZ3_FASGI|nr:1-phosphatidylinositol 3-phosphate 5-kinase [Fasciola gigantica]